MAYGQKVPAVALLKLLKSILISKEVKELLKTLETSPEDYNIMSLRKIFDMSGQLSTKLISFLSSLSLEGSTIITADTATALKKVERLIIKKLDCLDIPGPTPETPEEKLKALSYLSQLVLKEFDLTADKEWVNTLFTAEVVGGELTGEMAQAVASLIVAKGAQKAKQHFSKVIQEYQEANISPMDIPKETRQKLEKGELFTVSNTKKSEFLN